MLNMYTCTFRRWMGKCSICIPAHTDGGWVNAQYVYCTFRRWIGKCSICIPAHSDGGWVNAQYVYLHIQTVDG